MDNFLLQSQDEIKVATEEILSNLYTKKNCTNKIIEAAKDDLKLMFLNHNYNIDEVIQTLQVKYPGDKVNLLIEKIESLKSDILYSVLINHNAKYGKCITDFDWSVKLILGTSALKTLQYPLLQLTLNSTDKEGVRENKVFDMKKCELEKLINALECVDK